MNINDLPFASADVSHEGRGQKTFYLKPRKAVMLLHSFGYFNLKLSKTPGSIGFYIEGKAQAIKFQRPEHDKPFPLKNK